MDNKKQNKQEDGDKDVEEVRNGNNDKSNGKQKSDDIELEKPLNYIEENILNLTPKSNENALKKQIKLNFHYNDYIIDYNLNGDISTWTDGVFIEIYSSIKKKFKLNDIHFTIYDEEHKQVIDDMDDIKNEYKSKSKKLTNQDGNLYFHIISEDNSPNGMNDGNELKNNDSMDQLPTYDQLEEKKSEHKQEENKSNNSEKEAKIRNLSECDTKQMVVIVFDICNKIKSFRDYKYIFAAWFEENGMDGDAFLTFSRKEFGEEIVEAAADKQILGLALKFYKELHEYFKVKDDDKNIIKMPEEYKPSLSTGIFGTYLFHKDEDDDKKNDINLEEAMDLKSNDDDYSNELPLFVPNDKVYRIYLLYPYEVNDVYAALSSISAGISQKNSLCLFSDFCVADSEQH